MEDPDVTQLGKTFPNIKKDNSCFNFDEGMQVFYDVIEDRILFSRVRDASTNELFPLEFLMKIMKKEHGDHIVYIGEL
jgi:hypothetical protein